MSNDESRNPTPRGDVQADQEPRNSDAGSSPDAPHAAEKQAADDDDAISMDSAAAHLAADLEQLRSELEDAKNRTLRSTAELENYRKRANRQIEEERRFANIEVIRDLLPVWDNMGRAMEAAEKAGGAASLLEGFRMVQRQLEGVLERHHCVRIEALHQPFDPNLHEAISQMASAEHPAGTVLHVAQTGFRMHERVVRPSQVVVSTPLPAAEDDRSPEEPENDAGE